MFFLINFPSQGNEHKKNKAQIYDGMVQIYFSVFEAKRNYIVHLLSQDFEVSLALTGLGSHNRFEPHRDKICRQS